MVWLDIVQVPSRYDKIV